MKIALGADHKGFPLKEQIKEALLLEGHEVVDFGCYDEGRVDYPDIAIAASRAVAQGQCERGILMCNDGLGMCIVANKVRGIRCALCVDSYYAEIARVHNDANILAFGPADLYDDAMAIVHTFLKTPFEGGRHIPRLAKITKLENE